MNIDRVITVENLIVRYLAQEAESTIAATPVQLSEIVIYKFCPSETMKDVAKNIAALSLANKAFNQLCKTPLKTLKQSFEYRERDELVQYQRQMEYQTYGYTINWLPGGRYVIEI